jgi:hypothetical protein
MHRQCSRPPDDRKAPNPYEPREAQQIKPANLRCSAFQRWAVHAGMRGLSEQHVYKDALPVHTTTLPIKLPLKHISYNTAHHNPPQHVRCPVAMRFLLSITGLCSTLGYIIHQRSCHPHDSSQGGCERKQRFSAFPKNLRVSTNRSLARRPPQWWRYRR